MSAFLGPIHTWLYGKVLFQNGLVDAIEELAEKENWLTAEINVGDLGELEQGDLADICDPMNIHGWLQERVSLVERKLAYLVTELTKDAPERMTEISQQAYEYGKLNGISEEMSVFETYQYLETKLLNGMPCDHVNEIVEQDENHIIWQQVTDIHRRYWDEVNGNIEKFYMIRERLIDGIVEKSGHNAIARSNYIYEIR